MESDHDKSGDSERHLSPSFATLFVEPQTFGIILTEGSEDEHFKISEV